MYVIEVCTDNLRHDGPAGKQTVIRTICEQLQAKRMRFDVVIPHMQPILLNGLRAVGLPLTATSFEANYLWRLWTAYTALKVVGAKRLAPIQTEAGRVPVVIHAHDFVSASAFLRLQPHFERLRVVMTHHSAGLQIASSFDRHRDDGKEIRPTMCGKALYRWERETLRRVNRLVFVSSSARSEAVREYPELEGKSVVIHNASRLSAMSAGRPEGRRNRTPRICYIGRLSKEKGPDLYLDVAMMLAERGFQGDFFVAGTGRQGEWLKCEVERRALTNVHLLGFVRDVRTMMDDMDVCVIPSRAEALSMVALEAMASGLPIVAFRVGGLPEALGDDYFGLCSPLNTEEMCEKIISICANTRLYSTLSQALVQRSRMFTPDAMMDQYVDVFGMTTP